MHELAICQALIRQVVAIARDEQAVSVTDIHVGIGPLSGVEAVLLRHAFPVVAGGSVASAATLHLHARPVRVECAACGAETDASVNRLICGRCEDWHTRLVSGDELLLERVCMERGESRDRTDV
jgi:hydrogenase nickel incorporation protein HypA/HybF